MEDSKAWLWVRIVRDRSRDVLTGTPQSSPVDLMARTCFKQISRKNE